MYIYLLLLAFMAFAFPGLLFLVLLGFLLALPFILLIHSVQTLVLAPISLWQTFTDKQVRRNHALEHATANVLEEKFPQAYVGGMAFKDGFQLFGRIPPAMHLMQAAREGLQRLKQGETNLALHPRCGTSIMIGQVMFALVFLFVFFFMHHFNILEIFLFFLFSAIVSRPLGLLAQKYITTSTDVEELEFHDVYMKPNGAFYFQTARRQPVRHFWPWRQWRPTFGFRPFQ